MMHNVLDMQLFFLRGEIFRIPLVSSFIKIFGFVLYDIAESLRITYLLETGFI